MSLLGAHPDADLEGAPALLDLLYFSFSPSAESVVVEGDRWLVQSTLCFFSLDPGV